MSKIAEFAKAQTEYNDRLDTAIEGIAGDIKTMNDTITKLQNSQGEVDAADQASLDALQARGQSLAVKLEGIDELNPPTPPAS